MRVYAGVDIGGTNTKIGVLGEKLESASFATPHDKIALADAVAEQIRKMCTGSELCGVGVGVPGPVDKNGNVDFMVNLGISDFNAKELLGQRLHVPVAVSNDANVAALAECEYYGLTDVVVLTLGTGVGSGIVIDGKIYEGPNYKGGELGHMIVRADGRQCGCGLKGCLETYASATALIRSTKEAMKKDKKSLMWIVSGGIDKVSGETAFLAEAKGDASARRVIDRYVKYLGIGILNICNIFRPQAVIIGGGVSNQGENLIAKVREFCQNLDYGNKYAPVPQILKASRSGVYGSIYMIKKSVEEN